MRILNRYLIIEFLKPLSLSAAAFGGLVVISEFFRELNTFLEKKASFVFVVQYLALNFPWWIIQVLPVAVLLAVLFSLGELTRRNEITAIRAAGININSLLFLFIFLGGCIGLTEAVLREKVIPYTVARAQQIRSEKINKEPPQIRNEYYDFVVTLPRENARMTAGYLYVDKNLLGQIVVDYYDNDFRLERQMVAQTATYNGKEWQMHNGVMRLFQGTRYREEYFTDKTVDLSFKPMDYAINRIRPEQMTSGMMRQTIQKLRSVGAPSVAEEIQFHMRWASICSHMIVVLIGIPFALGFGGKHGKVLSFTFALIFAFCYWGVQAIGQSLGENKVVSPVVAAWMGNALFGIAGFFMLKKIQR